MKESILCLLQDSVKKYPDKIAFADQSRQITYREFWTEARKAGTFLAETHAKGLRNRPIAVIIDRNIDTLIAFFGIVFSGNFYASISMDLPEDRRNTIFKELDPLCIIDARNKGKVLEGTISLKGIISTAHIDDSLLDFIQSNSIDTDPLYTLFTSGSTGTPKGVLISHRSVLDLTDAFQDAFNFDSKCIFGNQAPFDFDVSVKDIYNSIYAGGTMHILPKKFFVMPKLLIEYLSLNKINTLIWAVSAVRILADIKAFNDSEYDIPLRYLMFSGEVMPVHVFNYWFENFPDAKFVNLYGPTEITCNCTYYTAARKFSDEEIIPIGKAFKNTRVFLLNDDNEIITKPNVSGELCVEGTGLALGYWNMPEKTASSFPQNPFLTEFGNRIYKTGDLAYFNDSMELCYSSRKDFQIKHFGHRIELQEIERTANTSPEINISCCVYDKENEHIILCFQGTADKKGILKHLSTRLPKYMLPHEFVYISHMPLTPHGKIDRKKLLNIALGKEKLNESDKTNIPDGLFRSSISMCVTASENLSRP
ncbi:MAG: amino acid adenylation domain-containing protein [Lachnospiraceae bacterium]|nr:amino acid adenylation domain-containing protein [Lachnospiraceae bacterium]